MNSLLAFALGAGGIVLIDIVLSGDNALVIGAAASRLPRRRQTAAIVLGGIVAAIFRIALTIGATELLRVRLLQAIGGVALLFIACRMLIPEGANGAGARRASDRLLPAIITILIADATMSIDNILAIGALARGNIALVTVGLLVSMVILFAASAVIARLIERFWWLLDLAALVIAYTAANLFIGDPFVGPLIDGQRYSYVYQAGAVALVLLFDIGARLWRRRATQTRPRIATPDATPGALDLAAYTNAEATPTEATLAPTGED
ncbi:MAG TPA: YjbE family putative metal transport protein [Ktedonobacterales bacterium]|nr:YjbE family putative metal transport protein [Ktedonobacterales bacterium]